MLFSGWVGASRLQPYTKRPLAIGQTIKREKVYWNLHAAYARLNAFQKAHPLPSEYVNQFAVKADYKVIHQLALSAASTGKTREAVTCLKIAKQKIPPTDLQYAIKIQKGLVVLGDNQALSPMKRIILDKMP